MRVSKSYTKLIILLIFLLIAVLVLNLSLGSVRIPINDIFEALTSFNPDKGTNHYIVLQYRLPKAITAVLVGSGLGASGLLMQTLFRNPLAGPYVLGLSSGASLGVALVILGSSLFGGYLGSLLLSKWSITIASSIGSFLVLLAVLAASIRVKNTMAILIIGLMFASVTAAIVSVLSYFSSAEQLQRYIFWSFGSLGDLSWTEIRVFLCIFAVGLLLSILSIKPLNSLLLGQDYAKSLGVNINSSRLVIIVATSLLAGSITAFAGPIAFIGLAVPHLTKLLINTSNHKIIVPAVLFTGAILMLICDTIAQLPYSVYTLPINAVTSLIGAPVVIWLLMRKKKLFV
ncbi:MAG: iron ABC transporter permease [Flavobacteriaceae bacterium]|nr:iron ABC transporter permease [Flavobacteriaceae bacterium]